MKIAELFVDLTTKGSEKTIDAFKSVSNSLGNLMSTSLATKAAIVGAVYGLERMMSASAQMGTNITNFTAETGLSTKQLQQWQYAAQLAGSSAEQMVGQIQGIQSSMAKLMYTGQGPKELGLFMSEVGFDENRMQDTFYVMQKLQEFAQSTKVPKDLGNEVLKSFGLSPEVIAGMRRNMFSPEIFKQAPVLSDRQAAHLDKVRQEWTKLGISIEMAFAKFTDKHGGELVRDVSVLATSVIALADAFTRLAESLKFFKALNFIAESQAALWGTVADAAKDVSKGKSLTESSAGRDLLGIFAPSRGGAGTVPNYNNAQMITPLLSNKNSASAAKSLNNTNNVTVNQNFQHDGKDHRKVGDATHQGVRTALRSNSQLTGRH